MAVNHEVRLAQLDHDNRGRAAIGEGGLERAETVAAVCVKRGEVAAEGGGAAVRANQGCKRDRAHADGPSPERLQPPFDLDQLEKAVLRRGSALHGSTHRMRGRAGAQSCYPDTVCARDGVHMAARPGPARLDHMTVALPRRVARAALVLGIAAATAGCFGG